MLALVGVPMVMGAPGDAPVVRTVALDGGVATSLAETTVVPVQRKSSAGPDWTLDPTYGSVELDSGFTPDPYTMNILAGGTVDIQSMGYYGMVAEAPDVDFYYDAGSFDLYIYVEDADSDTILLINDPAGNWHYNDDNAGFNPGIEFSNPQSGLYSIWVGTFGDDLADATLAISEFGFGSSSSSSTGSGPDWTLDATYGTVTLESGFTPDPYTRDILAGGSVDLNSIGFYGSVAAAPDLDFYYDAGGFDLYIYVERANVDTVLLINDPTGEWHFNDDNDGLNPGIEFRNPDSGLYSIWIGTFGDQMANSTLAISEFGF